MSLWERNPKLYIEVYMHGKKLPTTRAMAYGKMVHEALQHNRTTGDPVLDLVLSNIPKYKRFEHELRTKLKSGKTEIPLFSIIDNDDEKTQDFADFKTGQKWWTQRQVDENDQLTFYTTAKYAEFKVIPKNIALIQIQTTQDEQTQEIGVTGEYRVFKTTRDLADVLKMAGRIQRAWGEISDMVTKELV
jgi:hypothetical protein